jgi:KUP system potassium uptake protein
MLVVTGGEAMYADMGHFGRKPIRLSWFVLVFPALLLNYLGQGAYLLSGNKIIFGNIFYSLVPSVFLIPMVILATMATVIASQALISGAFSLTTQAMAFNLLPFIKVKHTNEEHHGQIYLPAVNWALYIGTIVLVLIFKSSASLAGAYGLAVSGVMLMTTLGMYFIARSYWNWSKIKTILLFLPLGIFEMLFLTANSLKIFQGGYIPLAIAIMILLIMIIWKWGTAIKENIQNKLVKKGMTIGELIKIKSNITPTDTIARSSLFLCTRFIEKTTDNIPAILQVFYQRYRELPEDIVILNVHIDRENPHLHDKRYQIIKFFEENKKGSIFSVKISFGFMEDPNVEALLENLAEHHEIKLDIGPSHWLIHALNKRLLFDENISLLKRIKFMIYNFLDNISIKADHHFGLGNETELTVEVVPVKFED